ncbi:MAG: FecR domain-containing protein [Verrucomicrobia bacterium]|nr:FecR domain-containing protein [Verrucomicrobiota bacterium]
MKNSFYSFLIVAAVMLGSVCAQGAEATAQAIVLAVKGPVNAVINGGNPTDIKVGDKLPQGTLISSGPGGQADIQVFNGAVATIHPDTTVTLEKLAITASGGVVTKQTALLNLKVGSIASNIDPANHNINDYGIRTPKGVAAARGTSYTVNVSSTGTVQVFVTNSAVTFYNAATGQTVKVPAGSKVVVAADGTIQPPVQMTSAELKTANAEGKPVEPGSITTSGDTNKNDNAPDQGNSSSKPAVIVLDPSPSA